MKKISDMELDELREYALKLEGDLEVKTGELESEQATTKELQDLNKHLQKRNYDLFMKVEQQATPVEEKEGEEPSAPQTCEELANNIYKGIIR